MIAYGIIYENTGIKNEEFGTLNFFFNYVILFYNSYMYFDGFNFRILNAGK